MLYKVTPMMAPPQTAKAKTTREPGQPRKRRKTAIYDGDGHEVLITLMCLKCKSMRPLAQFGLRKMADGAIRNQPWCRGCRSQAGTKPRKTDVEVDGTTAAQVTPDATTLAADPVVAAPLQVNEEAAAVVEAEAEAPVGVSAEAAEQADAESSQYVSAEGAESDADSSEQSDALPHAAESSPSLGH